MGTQTKPKLCNSCHSVIYVPHPAHARPKSQAVSNIRKVEAKRRHSFCPDTSLFPSQRHTPSLRICNLFRNKSKSKRKLFNQHENPSCTHCPQSNHLLMHSLASHYSRN